MCDPIHQSLAHGSRPHADEFDAAEIAARHQFALAQHHRDHRRHRGQPSAAEFLDRRDVGRRRKLRLQHDGRVPCAGELRQRQRVHVIERRGDEQAVALQVRSVQPRLHHPDVALVREHDALRRPGRSRRIEEQGRLIWLRNHRLERTGIDEAVKTLAFAGIIERDRGKIARAGAAPRGVAEHEPGAGVAQDEFDRGRREPVIDRHRDEARPHDAETGSDEFGAIGGEHGDALPARKPSRRERAGNAVRHDIEGSVRELAFRTAALIDDG